jgi:RNA polymerase sigma-70 factor (ECF subfamily)
MGVLATLYCEGRAGPESFVAAPPQPPTSDAILSLLGEIRAGSPDAETRLLALVYPSLRRLASHYMRTERADHTLQTTALVHEAYIRLIGSAAIDWQSQAHFYAMMATHMRRILVDYARARNAERGPGQAVRIAWQDDVAVDPGRTDDLVALDAALTRLAGVDARASRVVELRFFTGLKEQEAADVLGISLATLKRDWTFAKAWLYQALAG